MDFDNVKTEVEEYFHGHYVVEDYIGKGAFSEIFVIKHVFLDDLRVMKIIKKPLSYFSNIDSILQESRIVSRINNENIIKFYDAGIISLAKQNHVYFIMEYAPNGDLKQYIDVFINYNKLTPLYWVLTLIKQISIGLSVLHSSNPPIVHGDLKPENILLSFNWKNQVIVKISDFGFSKEVYSECSEFPITGTRPYMAPECFKKEFYTSSDIYSVGVIFYLFLTNHFPYGLDEFVNLKVLGDGELWKQPLLKPSEYNCEIPKIIDDIVVKCLSFDYNERFIDANELFDAINECLNGSIDFENEIYSMSEDVKRAFKLANYENKSEEAIKILDEYDMAMMFEKTIKNTDFNSHKTEVFQDFSEILGSFNQEIQ